MRVVLIAAVSADGFIARSSDELADWTGPEDKKFFAAETKKLGIMIMGRKTYETIGRPLPGRKTIVMTRDSKLRIPGVEVTNKGPSGIVKYLQSEGHESVAICGGRQIYEQFLSCGQVSEMKITVINTLLGSGLPLASMDLTKQFYVTGHLELSPDATVYTLTQGKGLNSQSFVDLFTQSN